MKVTNKLGLPQAIVDAVSVERHNQKGSYSATTLLHGACVYFNFVIMTFC